MSAGLVATCLTAIAGCATDPAADPSISADRTAVPGATSTPTPSAPTPTARTACWDGVTLPRPALEPVALPSVAAKYDAYNAALVTYQAQADAFSVLAAEHAAAYNAVATVVTGRLCSTDVDCDTGAPQFPGHCVQPYYGVGARCYVSDGAPVGAGPQPPPLPVITCADLSCAALANYACETEPNTGTNACILSRCATGGGGGAGGGAGGGSGGKGGGGKP